MSEFIFDPESPTTLAKYIRDNLWVLHPDKQVNVLLAFDNDRRLIDLITLEVSGEPPMWNVGEFSEGWAYITHLLHETGATNWMLAHNHNTDGAPNPSPDDERMTASATALGSRLGIHFRGMLLSNKEGTACGLLEAYPMNALSGARGDEIADIDIILADIDENGGEHITTFDDPDKKAAWLQMATELIEVGEKLNWAPAMVQALRDLRQQVASGGTPDVETYKTAMLELRKTFANHNPDEVVKDVVLPSRPQQPTTAQVANPFDLPRIDFGTADKNLLN